MSTQVEPRPAVAPALSAARPVSESGAPLAASATRRPSPVPIIVAAAALLVIAVFVRQWLVNRGTVSTDNAQVAGHVIPVLPRITGIVTDVRVIENQPVHEGDVLVKIDDRDERVRLAQAEAELQKEVANAGSNGRVGQAMAQLAAARANSEQARATDARAQADLERMQTLAARNIVSVQQLDAAQAAARADAALVRAADEQVLAAEAALRGADARVASARAARDQADLMLSYTTLAAPSSGVVSKKNVEVGQMVPLDDVWIVANLKETEIRGVQPGARAEITVDSYPGRRFRAHVESLSPATGATFSMLPPDNATGNFTKIVQRIPVRLRLDGPVDPAHPLRPGMSAFVRVWTH
jgi:membrane fusion protein (multidrug efflux system)